MTEFYVTDILVKLIKKATTYRLLGPRSDFLAVKKSPGSLNIEVGDDLCFPFCLYYVQILCLSLIYGSFVSSFAMDKLWINSDIFSRSTGPAAPTAEKTSWAVICEIFHVTSMLSFHSEKRQFKNWEKQLSFISCFKISQNCESLILYITMQLQI